MNRRVFAWAAVCAVAAGVSSSIAAAQTAKPRGVRPLPSGRGQVAKEEAEPAPAAPSKQRRAKAPSIAQPSGIRPLPSGRGKGAGVVRQSQSSQPQSQRIARSVVVREPVEEQYDETESATHYEEATTESTEYYDEQVEQTGYYEETASENPWVEEHEVMEAEPMYDSGPSMPAQRDFPWWVRGEYIGWWGKGIDLPALVTTSPAGTGAARAGLLGDPGTQVLFGDDSYDEDLRGGVRFTAGYWLDHGHCQGIEGYAFGLGEETLSYSNASQGGLPILARPFFNADPAVQQYVAQLLSHPDVANGQFDFNFKTETTGAGILLRTKAARSFEHNVDFLGGYRYTKLEDNMRIDDMLTSTAVGGNVPLGTVVAGFDQIDTNNEFHGVDLGMQVDFKKHRWTISFLGKCALGNMAQDISIDGSTTVTVPGAGSTTTAGGLLTQPTNIGEFSRDKFTVVPEANINARYVLNCRWTALLGYNFIYWNNVVRADDQVDFRVNTTQVGGGTLFGPGQPEMEFKETDYWLQGVNAGLELHF
jgi:hypothetical protein